MSEESVQTIHVWNEEIASMSEESVWTIHI